MTTDAAPRVSASRADAWAALEDAVRSEAKRLWLPLQDAFTEPPRRIPHAHARRIAGVAEEHGLALNDDDWAVLELDFRAWWRAFAADKDARENRSGQRLREYFAQKETIHAANDNHDHT